MTRRIIAKDGFDDYLPTLCLPDRKEIRVLEGVPASADTEKAACDWAIGIGEEGEEFLITFKADSDSFKVIRIKGDERAEKLFPAFV